MSAVLDYPSRLSDPNSRKFETFSYLPAMSEEQTRKQLEYILGQGWDPAIEHTEPSNAKGSYWYMWKLPLFGQRDVDVVMAEVNSCREANPHHHVRLIGYCNLTQSQGSAMVIHRGTIT